MISVGTFLSRKSDKNDLILWKNIK